MNQRAAKIVDMLREENLTIQQARLILEQAIRMLEWERLTPKEKLPVQDKCTGSGVISDSSPDHCSFSISDSESEDTASELYL